MKKNIYRLVVLAMAIFGVTACHPKFEGQMPGNDKDPKAAMYTFAPTKEDGDYDADTDVRVLITGNDKTQQVYYKAYKTDDVKSMTEAQIISDVVSSGQSVQNPGDGVNVFLTGLQGNNTICAVATNSNKQTLTEATFFGKTWTTVATGTLTAAFLDGSKNMTSVSGLELQHSEDNTELYRIKNAYGAGVHLPIAVVSDLMDDGGYYHAGGAYQITIEKTALPATYGNYGTVSVADYSTYRADESYLEYNYLYADYYMICYVAYTVSAGRISAPDITFIPD